MLRCDDEAQWLYLHFQQMSASLGEYASEQQPVAAEALRLDDESVSLAALAALEDSALATVVDISERDNGDRQGSESAGKSLNLSINDLGSVLRYAAFRLMSGRAVRYAGAAAVLALGVVIFLLMAGEPDAPQRVVTQPDTASRDKAGATLVATQHARWQLAEGAAAYSFGDTFEPGKRFTLVEGWAELTTPRGARVTLEAPCTFEILRGGNALRLHHGKMVGEVRDKRAKRFLVRTSSMDVTDLGTRFGIDTATGRFTEVHVFEGVVEVASPTQDASTRERVVNAGGALRSDSVGGGVTEIEHDPLQFIALNASGAQRAGLGLSPSAQEAGIAQLAGELAWSSMRPKVLLDRYELEDGPNAYIYGELAGHRLESDIPLTVHQTGTTRRFKDLQPGRAPAGTVIRTYLVCLNAGRDGGDIHAIGSVRFEGEVLGVIAEREHWFAFLQRTSRHAEGLFRFSYAGLGPQLEQDPGDPLRDEISISADRRTLALKLGGRDFAEILRVVVREPAQPTEP